MSNHFTTQPGVLEAFFSPRRVAVIGASRAPGKLGHDVLVDCAERGFAGEMFGVNPRSDGEKVGGWPVYRSLAEAGGEVDLALVAVAAGATPEAVATCAASGVRAAVLAAAGLGELGGTAALTEAEMARTAAESGMRLLGPNGFGLFVGRIGLNLMAWRDIPPGRVALLTQSGNVAIAICRLAARAGVGLSSCAGLGNQLDVDAADLLFHHARSDDCDAIALYIEGLRSSVGRRLVAALRACKQAGKPVVVLKAGASPAAAGATATHTGSLGGDDRLWKAVLTDTGAIPVRSTEELVDVLAALAALRVRSPTDAGRIRRHAGAGLALLSDGGGDSVMMLDALSEAKVPLASLSLATQSSLEPHIPPAAPRVPGRNPVTLDTPGGLEDDSRLLAQCAEVVAADQAVELIVAAGTIGGYRRQPDNELEMADRLVRIHRAGTPVLVHSAFAGDDEEPIARLRDGGVPVYPTARRLALALSRAGRWNSGSTGGVGDGVGHGNAVGHGGAAVGVGHGDAPVGAGNAADHGDAAVGNTTVGTSAGGPESAPRSPASPTPQLLSIEGAAKLFESVGIALPPMVVVSDATELGALLDSIPFPACLKVDDPSIPHKSDVGGVVLDVGPDELLPTAARLWRRFAGASLVVMPMLAPGLELMAGAGQDASFGPFVLVGRGGVTAELDPDVAVALAPVTVAEARKMWLSLRCAPLFEGWRSQPPKDLDSLAELAASISGLAADAPSLTIECNPVIAYPNGYAVADLRATRTGGP